MTRRDTPHLQEITGDAALLAAVYRLRMLAWRTQVALPEAMTEWTDGFDAVARHWAFLHQGQPVAAGRVSVHGALADIPDAETYEGVFTTPPPAPIASLNRLIVHPDWRGLGLPRVLDAVRVQAAEQMGAQCVVGATGSVQGNRVRIEQLAETGFVIAGLGVCSTISPIPDMEPPTIIICHLPRPSTPP